jgi:Domain of unknown function (DUF3943)
MVDEGCMDVRPAWHDDRRMVALQRVAALTSLCCVLSAVPVALAHGHEVRASTGALLDRSHEFSLQPDDAVTSGPDWVGLGRDTAFLIGYQLAVAGVLWVLPDDISGWSEREKDRGLDNWVRNVGRPDFDEDGWPMNYIAHPYWGATYYIRARERGFGGVQSFAYAAFASAAYEFGVEAVFERPSIQDLIVTPIAGALIGAFVFEPIRQRIKAKPDLAWYDHVGLVATDPIGALNRVFEGLLGIKSDIRVNLKVPGVTQATERTGRRGHVIGLEVSIPWD